jgi:hypothetical protein
MHLLVEQGEMRGLRDVNYVKRNKSTAPAHRLFKIKTLQCMPISCKKGAPENAHISPYIWRYATQKYRE